MSPSITPVGEDHRDAPNHFPRWAKQECKHSLGRLSWFQRQLWSIPMATLLRTPEVAELLNVSSSKLEHLRCLNRGPNWIRIGRQVRYRLEDITAYLDANTNRLNAK